MRYLKDAYYLSRLYRQGMLTDLLKKSICWKTNQVPSEQVEFADIYIGDELITVPVVIESEIAGKTARSGVQYEDTIESATYYIPVTEEGKAYNEEYVSGARARGTATDTYLDPRKYLK